MSATIRDYSKIREQEIAGLKKQITQERRALEEVHQKNKADLKQVQEYEIVELRDNHAQAIDKAHERKEKVLTELERNLNQTKNLTEKQLQTLKAKTKEEEYKIQDDHAERRLLLNANNEQYLQEANYRYNNQLNKLNAEGENRIQETSENLSLRHNAVVDNFENKLQQNSDQYNSTLARKEQEFQNITRQKEKEYKTKEVSLRDSHENKIVEQTTIHQDLYQKRDNDYKNKFHEQDQFFEKKFEGQLHSHQNQLGNLDQKFEKISQEMKHDLMTKIEAVKRKENDIFFEFTELNAKVKDKGDHYTIDVELPEYAKNDLRMTTNNKEILLTLNRRYQDQVEKDGIKHKVNKVETLSTRLPTEHFLNSKKISSNYNDGVMSYKIFKA